MLDYDPSRTALYTPERRDCLFEHGRGYTPVQIAVEAARLAYIRAESSVGELERLGEALARVGFGPPRLFLDPSTGTEAFGARRASDSTTLIAFRGTSPDALADLLTDANALLTPWPESAGRVHAGFASAARAVLPQVRAWLDESPREGGSLILTGHSLGAALATLAASVLRPTLVVTLGSPRVGDAAFTATLAGEMVRIVGCCDAVTDLPPPILYTHVLPSTYLARHGEQVVDPPASFIRRDRFRARWRYLLRHAWRKGTVLFRDFADHAPINYARAFF
jgi:hypothetical protein